MNKIDWMNKKEKVPTHTQHAFIIKDFYTEIITIGYQDKILIIITQLGKPGTMLMASKESKMLSNEEIFDIKTIFGKRDSDLNDILSRQIIQEITKTCQKPILFSFAFDPKFESLLEKEGYKEFLNPIIKLITTKGKVW